MRSGNDCGNLPAMLTQLLPAGIGWVEKMATLSLPPEADRRDDGEGVVDRMSYIGLWVMS